MASKKVLIIDDHAATRELIKWALDGAGLELHEASNGEAGLKAAMNLQPELIVLDVLMPGALDGYAVCKELRACDTLAKVKIVMLSANDSQADRQHGQAAGANAYLVKPFKPTALRSVAARLLSA